MSKLNSLSQILEDWRRMTSILMQKCYTVLVNTASLIDIQVVNNIMYTTTTQVHIASIHYTITTLYR